MSSHPTASTFPSAVTPAIMESTAPGNTDPNGAYSFDDVPRLTRHLKRGDESAFAWLHGQWNSRINRYCFVLAAGDEAFASEIAQGVWLRTVRSLRRLPDEAALWNWLACAARHAAIDLRRKEGRYLNALRRFAERCTESFTIECRDRDDADAQLLNALATALDQLDSLERQLVDGRYFEGEPLDSLAKRHELSIRAVEGRLARIRARLRTLTAQALESQA